MNSSDELEARVTFLEGLAREITAKISRTPLPKKPAKAKIDIGAGLSDPIWLATPGVTVNNAGGASVAWTTYNAFDSIPPDTTVVILDVAAANDVAGGNLQFYARRADGDVELEFASENGLSGICSGQIHCDVFMAADQRSFDYKITSPGGAATWTLRLIGYYKRLRVFGKDWSADTTGLTASDGSLSGGSGGKPGLSTGGLGTP